MSLTSNVNPSTLTLEFSAALHDSLEILISKQMGRVLTVVDASISDHEQRKAMKDIIKESFNSKAQDEAEKIAMHYASLIYEHCDRLENDPIGLSGTTIENEFKIPHRFEYLDFEYFRKPKSNQPI